MELLEPLSPRDLESSVSKRSHVSKDLGDLGEDFAALVAEVIAQIFLKRVV